MIGNWNIGEKVMTNNSGIYMFDYLIREIIIILKVVIFTRFPSFSILFSLIYFFLLPDNILIALMRNIREKMFLLEDILQLEKLLKLWITHDNLYRLKCFSSIKILPISLSLSNSNNFLTFKG